MVQFASLIALLACATAIGAQASPAVGNVAPRQARSEQDIRLQFMADAIGGPATPDMVADLRAPVIAQTIVKEAQKNGKANAPENPDGLVASTNASLTARQMSANFISGAVLDDLKLHQSYAAAAYCLRGISDWTCRERCSGPTAGTVIVKRFDDLVTNTVGYVGYNPSQKAIIVSFRGTLSIRNAINDLKLYKVDADYRLNRLPVARGARIHGGFADCYSAAKNDVRGAIRQILNGVGKDYTIHVVGHSMGGAIGILAGIDLLDFLGDSFADRIKVYSFGEPRVGNKEWADWVYTLPIHKNLYRITHNTDIVPHLPPKFLGYQHHRVEYWINKDGDLSDCDDSIGEAIACSAGIVIPSIIAHLVGYFAIPFGPWC